MKIGHRPATWLSCTVVGLGTPLAGCSAPADPPFEAAEAGSWIGPCNETDSTVEFRPGLFILEAQSGLPSVACRK